jgi:hypothetical protein
MQAPLLLATLFLPPATGYAATGDISTIAGDGTAAYGGDGGAATAAQINIPVGVALDASGNVFVSELSSDVIRRVDAITGTITTVAGNGSGGFSGDGGPATAAQLQDPNGVALDGAGNLFFVDTGNNRVRRVAAGSGTITTIAGTGSNGYGGDGGPATAAVLNAAFGLAIDASGNLFIADGGNNRVRRVAAGSGTITTVAGTGTASYGGDGGPATAADLNYPIWVGVDSTGSLLIGDAGNNRVRRVAAGSGTITTVAGNGTSGFSGDGGPATAAELGGVRSPSRSPSPMAPVISSSRTRAISACGASTP